MVTKQVITFLIFTNFCFANIEIIPINNPFLPFKLGSSRIIYNKHTFIHYINLEQLGNQVNEINSNYELLIKNLPINYHHDTFDNILFNIRNGLTSKIITLKEKFDNLIPYINHRPKRGLINFIGSAHKWLFGTLDADDGIMYDEAISKLQTNQKNIYNAMENQISLSKQTIDKFNITLTSIYNNQKNIKQAIEDRNHKDNSIHTFMVRLINKISLAQQLINNCESLIGLIDEIDNAIVFAKLNSINPSIIKVSQIQNMFKELEKFYPKDSIIHLENPLSNYLLLGTQVTFTSSKIIFAIHIPLVKPIQYSYFHILPIPQKNTLFLPTQPYVIYRDQETYASRDLCPQIEDIYYCSTDITDTDPCTSNAMLNKTPKTCMKFNIQISKTLLQRINNDIVIIPAKEESLETICTIDKIINLSEPTLIKLTSNCKIKITNLTFDFKVSTTTQKFLILPRIEIPEKVHLEHSKTIKLIEPDFKSLQDLRTGYHSLEPLQEPYQTHHAYTVLIVIILIIFLIIVTYIWYRCSLPYKCLKKQKKEVSAQDVEIQQIPIL